MSPQPLLALKGLSIEVAGMQGSLALLRNVTFAVERGEIVGMVGESGAGKSSVGSAIAGLLQPPVHQTGGEIWFNGRRIDQGNERDWRRLRGRHIGMIFQDPQTSLDPLFSIGDQLIETIQVHLRVPRAEARLRALSLLSEVGITDAARRLASYPHEFSGGQRQRIVIALALAAEPELIIADEPTSALDVSVQQQIIQLLLRIARDRGTAIILISHDLGVIAAACDKIGVMYCGSLVEFGPTQVVTSAPLHPYTMGLIACVPSLTHRRDRLADIGGEIPQLAHVPPGCSFHPRCAYRMERCSKETPAMIDDGSRLLSCWLHSAEAAPAADHTRAVA